jgi:hypothetical protein
MDIRQCHRHPDLTLGHEDQAVRQAARLIARLRRQPFLELAVGQMNLNPSTPRLLRRSVRALAIMYALTPEQESDAYELMDHAFSIATNSDPPGPSLRRGAFLERLVVELLLSRPVPDVREEVQFRFAERTSECIDVVGMTDDIIEVFECKTVPSDLTQSQLDALGVIGELAETDSFPKTVIAVVATLWSDDELMLAIAAEGLHLPAFPIHQSTIDTILGLSVGPAMERLS